MEKKKTKEKFTSPQPLSEQSTIFRPLLLRKGSHWMVVAPLAAIAFEVLSIAVIFSPFLERAPRPVPAMAIEGRSFAFAAASQNRLGKTLILNSDGVTVDVSPEIPFWQRRKLFSYQQILDSATRSRTAFPQVIFSQLGTHNPWQAFNDDESVWGFDLAEESIYNKLLTEMAPQIERPAQGAILKIANGRATEFRPELTGQSINYPQAVANIRQALFRRSTSIVVPKVTTEPGSRLADTNDLGINELVAHGESNFTGSSKNRIINISVGANRFNGLILKPGEEFSFNKSLGPVTAEDGFKPEIVIKPEGQVPELGGGLCQVSTTAFRAALYGGLPITARRNHSFAVAYYAPQGTDATIYPGAVDFKFVNNTPAHLLIATYVEGKKLVFDFYGTTDGRKVEIDGPYQYDFGAGGAMKARLTRTVTLGADKITNEFFSKYVSRNLFPRVEEFPKPATPAAETPAADQAGQNQTENLPTSN